MMVTNDSTEMENIIETGNLVETAVTEQTMITFVAEAETLEEDKYGLEGKNEGLEKQNEGADSETLEGELAMNEDEDYKENEVIGGDETCTVDKKAVDATGNDEGKDKPEPSRNKSYGKKKANSMGMIFMCNSETKEDCYRYKVLGLPANKKETVEKIYKGMRIFLYDVDLKLMYGIYKAAGRGGSNIQPKAFKSKFPSQVRFTVLKECLPLAEETFRQAIKKNYYTRGKFNCQLSPEQVKDLCKLFSNAGKGSRSKDTRLGLETTVVPKGDRAKRRGWDERRCPDRARRSEWVEDRQYREQVEDRLYREHPHLHERSLITSSLVPLAPLQPLNLRRDLYRRDIVIGNTDVYQRRILVERREYRRPLNLETRLQAAGGINDPYVSYCERLSYHDPVNSVRSQPEYNPPPVGLRSEYRHGLSTMYSSVRSILPEYPSSAASSLYEYPCQPRYRY